MPKTFKITTVFTLQDKTSRKLGRIQSKIQRFTARASRAMRKLNRVASRAAAALTRGFKVGAIAAAAGAGILFSAINRTAAKMDDLAKKTRAIQFPIEEFQEFRFAAEQTGVSTEGFDKSLGKFTKTVGELKGGYGTMFTALKKTNPALLKQLKNADNVSDAFEIYLGAIRETPNAMKKAALSTAAFGRTSLDMINMANLSAEELASLRAEMRENGVVTQEQAEKAEVYNDMMNRLKLTITGLVVDVLTPLMPILKEIADRMRKWLVQNKGLISSKFKEYLGWIVENFGLIVKWGAKIGKGVAVFYGMVVAIKALNAVMAILNALAAANPIGLVIIAAAGLLALTQVYEKEIQEYLFEVFDAYAYAWLLIKQLFAEAVDYITETWGQITDFVTSAWESTVATVVAAVDVMKDLFGAFVALFTGDWDTAGEKFISVWERIKSAALTVIDVIKTALSPLIEGFDALQSLFGDEPEMAGTLGGGGVSRIGGFAPGGFSAVGATAVAAAGRPSVSVSSSSTSSKEQVEVTIKDDTGRASVTKGKQGRSLKLKQTGGLI